VTLRVLIGGARAGKSRLATALAGQWAGPVAYVATAEERDAEMSARVERHRADRPDGWRTVEEPIRLRAALEALGDDEAAVVDCLTLWVANLLEHGHGPAAIADDAERTATGAAARKAPVIVVTNEVGLGIVPANELARSYRDVLGEVNRIFVAHADDAVLVVAGRVLRLGEVE
jgi:adenosylcobinamide kinase / adenosylcobinamide-phosphate guanylyltransferase